MADFSFSKTSLDEFRTAYMEEFGEELQQDDLERKARFVLNMYRAIYRSPLDAIREDEVNQVPV